MYLYPKVYMCTCTPDTNTRSDDVCVAGESHSGGPEVPTPGGADHVHRLLPGEENAQRRCGEGVHVKLAQGMQLGCRLEIGKIRLQKIQNGELP